MASVYGSPEPVKLTAGGASGLADSANDFSSIKSN